MDGQSDAGKDVAESAGEGLHGGENAEGSRSVPRRRLRRFPESKRNGVRDKSAVGDVRGEAEKGGGGVGVGGSVQLCASLGFLLSTSSSRGPKPASFGLANYPRSAIVARPWHVSVSF